MLSAKRGNYWYHC